MSAEAQKPKLDDLRGDLRYDFNLLLPFEGEEYKIYGTYRHERRSDLDRKELTIRIPDICVPPSGYNGLNVEFTKYSDGHKFALAKVGKGYKDQDAEAQKFFEESVQPVLLANLPSYIKRLITFKANK